MRCSFAVYFKAVSVIFTARRHEKTRALAGDPRYCDNVLVFVLTQSLALAGSGKCQP